MEHLHYPRFTAHMPSIMFTDGVTNCCNIGMHRICSVISCPDNNMTLLGRFRHGR